MQIEIKLDIDDDCGESRTDAIDAIEFVLESVPRKVGEILRRRPCLCDAPESADTLRDYNGNTIGSIKVVTE